MMRRVLGNNPDIFMLEELHFFEQLWSSGDQEKVLSVPDAAVLASKMIFIQRDGYLTEMQVQKHYEEAMNMVSSMTAALYPHEVLRAFLYYETQRAGRSIPCEKTPQDVFYIKEILELFPEAKVINMVRDPRGVMLSQKRKWQRRSMGASFMTKKEQRRLRINYHPITISKLWNASQRAALPYTNHERVHTVIFEELVNHSDARVRELCTFLEIDFKEQMLAIPQVGSSNEADMPDSFGIKTDRAGNWEKGGLNKGEIWFCQRICREYMLSYGYSVKPVAPSVFFPVWYYISFPFKIALALLFNLHRMKNIGEAIRRRLR